MLRTKIIIALSLTLVPIGISEARAAEAYPIVLVHAGEKYEYYMSLDGDLIKIDGTLITNGDKFSLTVKPSGHVTGNFGRNSVDYSVRKSTRDRLAARLKSQQSIALSDASNP
jgi:hypothetical protein